MLSRPQFLRDLALELYSVPFRDGVEFRPLSVGGFNFLANDGAQAPLFFGIACDSRIVQNPLLLLNKDFLEGLIVDIEYIEQATAWGKVQLDYLAAFEPMQTKKTTGKGRSFFCVRPWQTSIYEVLKDCDEYKADFEEQAESMASVFEELTKSL